MNETKILVIINTNTTMCSRLNQLKSITKATARSMRICFQNNNNAYGDVEQSSVRGPAVRRGRSDEVQSYALWWNNNTHTHTHSQFN